MHFILYELHHRVEQIGEKPRYEERQKNTAEIVGHIEYGEYKTADAYPAHKFVKSYLLFHFSISCGANSVCHPTPSLSFQPIIALPAQRLIFGLFAYEHLFVIMNKAVAYVGQCAAPHADGMHLRHLIGNGT